MKQAIHLLAIMLLLLPAAAVAQVGTATLLGTVSDSAGNPIAGASVVIRNSATGVTHEFTTGQDGNFTFPYLAAGAYQVTAAKASFKTKVVNNFTLEVEQRGRLDLSMVPGEVQQQIQVSATGAAISTDTSTIGQVISNQQVETLPLNGRNWISLAFVAPGVTANAPGTNADFYGQGGSVSISGGRQQDNNFTIDGTGNNELAIGGFNLNLSVEAIQEFKVQNNLYSAEYGRSAGGQINLATKSGTNQFHGDVFDFLRNSYFDANNYFTRVSPSLRRNQFGGTLGGPLMRNRLFFFLDYEGERLAQSLTQTGATPTAAERQGIFPTTIIDPTTHAPFPNNTIPGSRISTISSQILSLYYPLPNTSGPVNNYTNLTPSTENNDQYTVRVDWKLSDKDTLFGRVSHSMVHRFTPSIFNNFGNGTNLTPTNATLDNVYVFSPRQINEFRVGVNRAINATAFNQVFGHDLITPLGIQGIVPISSPQYIGLTTFSIAGFPRIGPNPYSPVADFSTFLDFLDDYTYIKGKHTIKAGVEIKPMHNYNETGILLNGTMSFAPLYTQNSLADFLLGYPQSTSIGRGGSREYLQAIERYFYIMDDWRAMDGLTLNLGLRYEYNPQWVEKQNRLADIAFGPNGTSTQLIAGVGGVSRGIIKPERTDVAPRIGFAYQPSGLKNTVIRGGYGIFFNQVITNIPFYMRLSPPFFSTLSVTNSAAGVIATLQNPFPSGSGLLAGAAYWVDPNLRNGYVQQWNLNIQRQLSSDMVAEISYVGSKGSRLPLGIAQNQAIPGPGPTQSRRPYPAYGQLFGIVGAGGSSYNAFQAKLEKQGHGLYTLLGYTFSKSLDNGSSTQTGSPQNTNDIAAEWGRSTFDINSSFIGDYVWQLPFGRGRHWLNSSSLMSRIVGGWSLTGIVLARTGFPFSVTLSGDNSGSGSGLDRPNRIGVGTVPSSQRTINHWLDRAAFTMPAQYIFGNSGRDILSGPGYVNWDQGIMKTIPTYKDQRLQLRFEAFNSLNHPNFSNPASVWNVPTFGTISSASDPRILQFAAKYIF